MFVNGTTFGFYGAPGVTFTSIPMSATEGGSDEPHNKMAAFRSRWRILGPNMNLTFTPSGHFHGDFHYGVLDGDLYHMWGTLDGIAPLCAADPASIAPSTLNDLPKEVVGNLQHAYHSEMKTCLSLSGGVSGVRSVLLRGVPAVLEDHYAKW